MTRTLKSICRVEVGVYEISLEASPDEPCRRFVMRIDDGDSWVVTWGDDFSKYMNHVTAPAKELFAAVAAFHRAQAISFPK